MKVSVITVTYNSKNYIENCILSVINQNYTPIEHIIIDGGSVDGTLDIISHYSEKIIWLTEKDYGIYDAINKGISLATGDIIGVLNSDDFFKDNNVVKRIVESFDNESIQAVFADVLFVKRHDITKHIRYYSSKYFKSWMFMFGMQPAHPTFYARRSLFDKYGNYRVDLNIAGDFEILLRFLKKYKLRYKYVNEIWVIMRLGGISTSGISSTIKLNKEIIKAHYYNGLYTNIFLVYSKYFFKWWGYLSKK